PLGRAERPHRRRRGPAPGLVCRRQTAPRRSRRASRRRRHRRDRARRCHGRRGAGGGLRFRRGAAARTPPRVDIGSAPGRFRSHRYISARLEADYDLDESTFMSRSAQPRPDDSNRTPSSDSFESAELRNSGDGLSSSQKLMILVLSMTHYGVGDIVASVLPEISVGPLELGVSYFSFIAVVLAALLNPVWVALRAPLGELVSSAMLLGAFAGLSELEGYLETALAIYVAGVIVRDPC